MANTISALSAAILSGAQDVLAQEFNLPKLVNPDFRNTRMKAGDPISIANVPSVQTATTVTPSNTPPALTDNTIAAQTYSLNSWYRSPQFYLNAQDKQKLTDGSSYVPQMLKEASRGLIYQASSDLFAQYKKIYGYVGTAATNMFATDTGVVADADKILNDQLCPQGNRIGLISNATKQAGLKLNAFNQGYWRGDQKSILTGDLGNQFGLTFLRDSQVPTHTAGTITTGLINKTATAIALGAVTTTATTAASTGACALVVGDIILFAGDTQTYVVTAACTQAVAATDVTLTFSPGKKLAATGGEAITVKATHVVNMAIDPSAIAWTMVFADDDDGAIETAHYVDPTTNIPLTLKRYGLYHAESWELSCLYGMLLYDPRKACRMAS